MTATTASTSPSLRRHFPFMAGCPSRPRTMNPSLSKNRTVERRKSRVGAPIETKAFAAASLAHKSATSACASSGKRSAGMTSARATSALSARSGSASIPSALTCGTQTRTVSNRADHTFGPARLSVSPGEYRPRKTNLLHRIMRQSTPCRELRGSRRGRARNPSSFSGQKRQSRIGWEVVVAPGLGARHPSRAQITEEQVRIYHY